MNYNSKEDFATVKLVNGKGGKVVFKVSASGEVDFEQTFRGEAMDINELLEAMPGEGWGLDYFELYFGSQPCRESYKANSGLYVAELEALEELSRERVKANLALGRHGFMIESLTEDLRMWRVRLADMALSGRA